MAKRIICKNEDGVQVEFNYSFEPFFLVSVDGIYTVSNNVVTSENTMVDGSTYQGSTTKQRNIVITAQMERDYQANRDLLYKCFKPKSTGLFTYIEGSETRVIDYKVEGIDIDEAALSFSISFNTSAVLSANGSFSSRNSCGHSKRPVQLAMDTEISSRSRKNGSGQRREILKFLTTPASSMSIPSTL